MASFVVASPLPYVGEIFGADNFPMHIEQGIVTANQTVSQAGAPTVTTLLAGTVVAILTSGSTLSICTAGNSNGSQTPVGVLLENAETSSTASNQSTTPIAYAVTGSFLSDKLLFGSTDTYATHASQLNALNIYGESSYTIPTGTYNS